ncbi:MAG: cell division protein FtsA, partial [Flavobacteriales bacterium]|nr:cell division protein FtsA [Flavobacteriales bacterium]
EIKSYGCDDPKKKLIAGIVLTGGGSQLKHIKQLVEYITGMDTRIGYPNEHLAGNSDEELSSPLFATAVGLMMNSINNNTKSAILMSEMESVTTDVKKEEPKQEPIAEAPKPVEVKKESTEQIKRSFFDKYVERIKEFLDNAE